MSVFRRLANKRAIVFVLFTFISTIAFGNVEQIYSASDTEKINSSKGVSSCNLMMGHQSFKCSFGRSGITANKIEGDGATPIGNFQLREIYYRPDRINPSELKTKLPLKIIHKNDGWCDDVNSPQYNKLVKLPFKGSYESLWQAEHFYDVIVIVGYNDHPPVKGKGSAIFLHIAKQNYLPTSGCIAFSKQDLLNLIQHLTSTTTLHIGPDSIRLINEKKDVSSKH